MTNLCCETTARDAFMRDYRIFFMIDGTATRRDDLHLATLKNLGFCFATLLTRDELIQTIWVVIRGEMKRTTFSMSLSSRSSIVVRAV